MFLDRQKIGKIAQKSVSELVIGFTASSFDLLHPGHIVMLQEARSLCDYLIVGLLTDPTIDRPEKNKPTQSIFERYVQLASCRYVDEVIPFESETDLVDMILTIGPDVRICGDEYEGKQHTGYDLCKIHYNKRKHSFSSTNLKERIIKAGIKV